MAFSVNQPNFNGKAAGFFISAALKEATSLEYLTMIENIKYKSNVQTMAGTNLVVDNACNYVSAGNLALEEKTLEPKRLMLNLDICKEELTTSYEALQMRAGVDGMPSVTFEDYVISYLGEIIANATEDSIWAGTAVAGQFNGFVGAVTGYLLPGVDGSVIQDAATGAYTAGTIIGELQAAVAAIPTTTLGKDDLHIYMSQRTYQYYIGAVSTLGYVNAYQMNGDYVPMFEGYKLAVCSGMVENQVVIAQKSNMFFGTDLLSDSTRISLLDMNPVNGSDVIRCVARYSAGVQTGIGADIVRQS